MYGVTAFAREAEIAGMPRVSRPSGCRIYSSCAEIDRNPTFRINIARNKRLIDRLVFIETFPCFRTLTLLKKPLQYFISQVSLTITDRLDARSNNFSPKNISPFRPSLL